MTTTGRDGLLLVDKPSGVSSHDVVATVRRARAGVKAGHTGTLDPFATGLLLVALGHATRLIRFIPSGPKVYRATIAFGAATDTDDVTGRVIGGGPVPDDDAVHAALATLTGEIEQVPPQYSARHVGGRRAYQIARTGATPALAPARVLVHQWEVHGREENLLSATITCGAGTYIRALARDLGHACGTVAHLATLRRLRIGPFDVRNAVPPDETAGATPLSPVEAIADMPREPLDAEAVRLVRQGRAVPARHVGERAALLDASGGLVAIAGRDGELWQPRVVLADD